MEADFIIIGAGSAGCVLAHRLTESGTCSAILLEAGGDDRPLHQLDQFFSNLMIHLPAGFVRLLGDGKINWNYLTEPDPGSANRVHAFARGKVLGGSSSINGMIYIRSLPEDFDGWRQMGCAGWSWQDVVPYFHRAERQRDRSADIGGTDGPLDVGDTPFRHPVSDAMIAAFAEAGAPLSADLNGNAREGAAFVRQNIRDGLRRSTAAAYLRASRRGKTLRIEKRAQATRILFDGKRAIGVEFIRGGQRHVCHARREVILAGGTINSPQLLELSGIGCGERLAGLGIPVVHANPRVGEDLQDHYCSLIQMRLKPGSPSINTMAGGAGLAGQMLKWAFRRAGMLTLAGAHVTAFLRSAPERDLPDLQFFGSPGTVDIHATALSGKIAMHREPGLTLGGYVMRPQSRGSVHISSPDPFAYPAIRPNFLAAESDRIGSIAALRWVRRVLSQPALAAYLEEEIVPGASAQTDADLLDFIRATGSTGYHNVGTCAMGSVLDSQLRVMGVSGLRVVDASVMPAIVSGNTHASTVMIAEKASDMILADAC